MVIRFNQSVQKKTTTKDSDREEELTELPPKHNSCRPGQQRKRGKGGIAHAFVSQIPGSAPRSTRGAKIFFGRYSDFPVRFRCEDLHLLYHRRLLLSVCHSSSEESGTENGFIGVPSSLVCAGGKCKLCGNQCTTIGLSSSMKPDVQMYFTDPDTLLKKKLKEVNQVAEFQKNHRARLMAHQRKQLKRFKTVKDDFRKLLNNLKELDNSRKQLTQENEMLKKFLSSSFQKSQSDHVSSSARKDRGSKGGNCTPSPSTIQSVLTKFMSNSNSSYCQIDKSQRISVISPPLNGKLGIIQATPSPSSAMQHLQLSSARSLDSISKKNGDFISPMSTPGSNYKSFSSGFTTPQSTTSPYGNFTPPSDQGNKYKRDVKKMVVHPFSSQE